MRGLIGVLGGMGPLATVDFMGKVIVLSPAARDQDHLPLIVHSVPQVPDRSASILKGAESPLPAMRQGLRTLVGAGAECIAIACNSAHYWYDDLAGESTVPLLHIVDAVGAAMARRGIRDGPVGLLATAGTVFRRHLPSAARRTRLHVRGSWRARPRGLGHARDRAGEGGTTRGRPGAPRGRGGQTSQAGGADSDPWLHRDTAGPQGRG